jgi:thioredoxin-dependent peroxiredoxin
MAKELKEGDAAPAFKVESTEGEGLRGLKDLQGAAKSKRVAIFFYPKDMTSGCTQEACDFRDAAAKFRKLGVAVYGVSKDSLKSHAKFIEKESLNFPLLSDESGRMVEAFGVWKEKSMYGRKYMGVERSTFLIGPTGKLERVWRKVKVPGHVDEVLAAAKG